MSTFTTSLFKVVGGRNVCYIKGVQHLGHNICDKTLSAFTQSNLYLHETSLHLVRQGAMKNNIIGTEYIFSKMINNKKSVYLDGMCRDINARRDRLYPIKKEDKDALFSRYHTANPVSDQELANIIIGFESTPMTNEYYNLLIVDRNKRWLHAILQAISNGYRCFVLCGAAHVNDLIIRLEDNGYSVIGVPQGSLLNL